MTNPKSLTSLLILLSVVLFLTGIHLGKEIEKVNKTVLPPTNTPTMTAPTRVSLAYQTYLNHACGISFLYPNTLDTKESSTSATLFDQNNSAYITCGVKEIADYKKSIQGLASSRTMIVNGSTISVYEIKNVESFLLIHPGNGKSVLVETSKNLTDLVGRSIQFEK